MDAYKKCSANVQCTVDKRWMYTKKEGCANVQCTVDKRWMYTKKKGVAPMYNVPLIKDGCTQDKVALKDGCAQTIVALLYNVRDEKYGCTKSGASEQCSQ